MIKKILNVFGMVGNFICIACIVIEMFTVVADVILRMGFNHPIKGVTELTQSCWVIMALSIGYVALLNAHTKVDILVTRFPLLLQKIVVLITNLAAAAYCGLAGWRTILKALSVKASNSMFFMLGIKEWPIVMLFAISFVLATFCFIAVAIDEWLHVSAAEIDISAKEAAAAVKEDE